MASPPSTPATRGGRVFRWARPLRHVLFSPMPMAGTRTRRWCGTSHGSGRTRNDTFPIVSHGVIPPPRKSSALCPFTAPSPPTPTTLGLFRLSPFPECHRAGIIQYAAYAAFSDRLFTQARVFEVHVSAAQEYSAVWVDHSLFIRSPTEGHLGG